MNHTTVHLNFSKGDKLFLWLILPLIGLVIGYFLPPISEWASKLEWIPFQGPFKLVASLNAGWVIFATMAFGLVASIILTLLIYDEILNIYISEDTLAFKIGKIDMSYDKDNISYIYVDHKDLVVIGHEGHELFRYKKELSTKILKEELGERGYLFKDGNPYKEQFKKWVPGLTDLPLEANALLKARDVALKNDDSEEALQIVFELWKLHVSVKEIESKQYYRVV
ncbi:YqeB family protein [Viridibacillus sp. NPDC096237]|uniref:YqeB family protein n=1 Tax=Viridibacillus sp. NPDC096237 TaxID=3390721 RepID=UPI003D014B30